MGSVWNGSIWKKPVPYFKCKRDKIPSGSVNKHRGGGICAVRAKIS